jgi:hypothetical protein
MPMSNRIAKSVVSHLFALAFWLLQFPSISSHLINLSFPDRCKTKQWQRQMRRLRDEESAMGLGVVRHRLLPGMQRRSQVRTSTRIAEQHDMLPRSPKYYITCM